MFVVTIEYKVDLSEVEPHISAHMQYIDKHYKAGHFLLSGRKQPRTGGVILAKAESMTKMQAIVAEDPFFQADIANFEIIEFVASNSSAELAGLRE
ncbi:YciI family protein [Gynuella sp.]|uniref:YciI family protein n=1 Tax=Gynuella sp. TaxID=2969146 RepID=UPI003D127A37